MIELGGEVRADVVGSCLFQGGDSERPSISKGRGTVRPVASAITRSCRVNHHRLTISHGEAL